MIPRQIRLTPDGRMVVTWDDSHQSIYGLPYLRDRCPCAACLEERSQGKSLLPILVEGKYSVRNVVQVGNYAISIEWGDGHNLGIYSFEYLRSICPCPDHANIPL